PRKVNSTLRSPTFSAFSTSPNIVAKFGEPLDFSVSKLQITSSTVIGVPSCHFACGLSVKATEVRSSGHSIVSAIRPYIEKASSGEGQHSVIQSWPLPLGETPLT